MANTQNRAFQDGSLGHVFQDGSLGVLGGGAFRDGSLGSLGAGAPRPQLSMNMNQLSYKMRMLRKRLGIQGIGAAKPRPQSDAAKRRWYFLRALKQRLGIKGLGQDEDVSVKLSPTVKALGFVTIAGLGAYGIYRLTSKKK